MIPSKYEGSILEDEIVEEPFTIEVGANMKTLDQLVIDTIAQNLQSYKVNAPTAAKIASEIREWMREQNDGLRSAVYDKLCVRMPVAYPSTDIQSITDAILSVIPPPRDEMFQAAIAVYESRIKELEAEVERLANLKSSPECCDKATKYDVLRERFPFWPGEEFYAVDGNVISKHAVRAVYFDHVATQNGFPYGHNQCHPTADACRAAIPVEE